MLFKLISAVL